MSSRSWNSLTTGSEYYLQVMLATDVEILGSDFGEDNHAVFKFFDCDAVSLG